MNFSNNFAGVKKQLARLMGLTRSGSSLLGKAVVKVRFSKRVRKAASLFFLGAVFSTIIFHNLTLGTSIGGIPTIWSSQEVKSGPVVTKITVQVPVKTIYVSRGYSWFHSGIDLVAKLGEPVYPVMDGKVVLAEKSWFGYGNHVIVDHGGGFTSLYGHFSKIDVKKDDEVTVKIKLGECGSTGFSTGPHVHLEIRQNNQLIDPAEILPDVVPTGTN